MYFRSINMPVPEEKKALRKDVRAGVYVCVQKQMGVCSTIPWHFALNTQAFQSQFY